VAGEDYPPDRKGVEISLKCFVGQCPLERRTHEDMEPKKADRGSPNDHGKNFFRLQLDRNVIVVNGKTSEDSDEIFVYSELSACISIPPRLRTKSRKSDKVQLDGKTFTQELREPNSDSIEVLA
jgi:hypothetical protein